jgi:hypothetical protein
MQSRPDLETDLGLALIKQHDSEGQRTIGVLTKPDLMNSEEHVGCYLTNTISKNLMLTYGYYVVRNRSGSEMKHDILKGFEIEKEYFANHKEYSKSIYTERIGMPNLTFDLSKVLISSITEMIPSVMTEIAALEGMVNKKLETMGEEIPHTKEGKISVLNKYVSNFSSRFQDSIESRGTLLNGGKKIKDIFINYRENLNIIKPFNDKNIYNEKYFKEVISSFDGNHMSFHIPPVQVLEACMNDEKLKPISLLRDPSSECVNKIANTLIDIIKGISKLDEFSQFPPLSTYMLNIIVDNVISRIKIIAKTRVNELIDVEESYIWTDSKMFVEVLKKTTSDGLQIDSIPVLLDSYYNCIKNMISHTVPKIIMHNMVRNIEKSLLSYLIQNLVNEDVTTLLKRDEQIEKQRQYYADLSERIKSIKSTFNNNIN